MIAVRARRAGRDRSLAATPASRGVVLWLARVEGGRLLRHPLFLATLALSLLLSLTYAGASDIGGRYLVLLGPTLLPLAVAVLVLANLAVLRSRPNGMGELYAAVPASERTRLLGHLLSLAWPVAAAVALVLAGFVAFGAWDGLVVTYDGPTRSPGPLELAQGPAAVAALGALGIALARWVPHPAAAIAAALGVLFFTMPYTLWNFQGATGWLLPLVNPARTTNTYWSWPCSSDLEGVCTLHSLQTTSLAWHVVYLAAVALVLAAVALLRDGGARWDRAAALVAGAVAVTAAVVQVP